MKAIVGDSRKSTHQIMANAGFGDTVITQGVVQVVLPQKAIRQNDGAMKKAVGARLMDLATLTLAEAQKLHTTYGVEVTVCK